MVYGSNLEVRPGSFDSPLVICRTFNATTCFNCDPNPLSIVFPHPYLYEDATTITGHGDLTFKISLLKGLQYPWPCEIQSIDRSRWITNNLKTWVDYFEGPHSLQVHLNCQFLLGEQSLPITSIEKSPLNSIRESIKKLFLEPKYVFLFITHQADLFRVKVHQPIVISPTGCPMLVVSVHDHRMRNYLEKENKLDSKEDDKFCEKILKDGLRAGETIMEVKANPEEISLWRYLFHVNSTKIVPTLYQKEKIPVGQTSPWTVTFISPLYLDCPFEKFLSGELTPSCPSIISRQMDEKVCCAACKKMAENLKRCSRCRVVFYCSVECQRGHWGQHKSTCAKK